MKDGTVQDFDQSILTFRLLQPPIKRQKSNWKEIISPIKPCSNVATGLRPFLSLPCPTREGIFPSQEEEEEAEEYIFRFGFVFVLSGGSFAMQPLASRCGAPPPLPRPPARCNDGNQQASVLVRAFWLVGPWTATSPIIGRHLLIGPLLKTNTNISLMGHFVCLLLHRWSPTGQKNPFTNNQTQFFLALPPPPTHLPFLSNFIVFFFLFRVSRRGISENRFHSIRFLEHSQTWENHQRSFSAISPVSLYVFHFCPFFLKNQKKKRKKKCLNESYEYL